MRGLMLSLGLGRYPDPVKRSGEGIAAVHDALDRGARQPGTLGEFVLGPSFAVQYGGNLLLCGHGAKVRKAFRTCNGKSFNYFRLIVA
jgi:hypothetical protein